MGWFHTNLKSLRKTLSQIEDTPSVENVNTFHNEVAEKLTVLTKELEDTRYLMSTGGLISDKLRGIESSFKQMVFQKGEVEGLSPKALRQEVKLFNTELNRISRDLDWIRQRIGVLEKVVNLVKIEEDEEEK